MIAAACRGRASRLPEPLCSDPWASVLAGPDGEALLDEILACYADAFPRQDQLIGLRTGYLDAYIHQHTRVRPDADQVVILGAGLDTRAARLAHAGVRYFEVDHPESQAYKLQQLAALPGYPREAATHVACDFEHADFLDLLVESGFRPDRPALFILEGVVHYLSDSLVRKSLAPIAERCHPASTLLFDYLSRTLDAYDVRETQVSEHGEFVLWTCDDPLPLLTELGFRHVRTTPFTQLFAGATGSARAERDFIHTCFFARATRATPVPHYVW